jgi:hypothetical protein
MAETQGKDGISQMIRRRGLEERIIRVGRNLWSLTLRENDHHPRMRWSEEDGIIVALNVACQDTSPAPTGRDNKGRNNGNPGTNKSMQPELDQWITAVEENNPSRPRNCVHQVAELD